MPDLLDSTGLTTKTRTELVAELEAGFRSIYGADINLDANSPDAQLIQIFAQAGVDLRELLTSIYNSFDPDAAVGRVLDKRAAINGIYRNAGTYTSLPVNVTVDRGILLPGLDDYPESGAFTIADNTGTKFSLLQSQSLIAGTHSLTFRAVNLGAVLASAHALTFIVTPTLGVTAVDNAAAATDIGVDEETDYAFRQRRMRALAVPARGSFESMLSAILAVEGVSEATLYENTTNSTDANGVDPHGAWAIVDGGTDTAVANAIYTRRPLGTPLKGSTTVNVTQVDGSTFAVKFSRPTPELLYVNYSMASSNGVTVDYAGLGYRLIETMTFAIGAKADATTIVATLKSLQSNILVTNEGVSLTNSGYASQVAPTSVDRQFYLTDQSVYINGTKLADL